MGIAKPIGRNLKVRVNGVWECSVVCVAIVVLAAELNSGPIWGWNESSTKQRRQNQIPLGISPFLPIPEDNPLTSEKAKLGRRLFLDKNLSADGSISCATCHQPEHAFTDRRKIAEGTQRRLGRRNTPSLLNVAFAESLFWDGGAKSLEEQALRPLTNAVEMGNELSLVRDYLLSDSSYRKEFEGAFGTGEISSSHIAKALASYQRTLLSGDTPYDRYLVLDDFSAMSSAAQRGYALFRGKARCAFCHEEPLFTDGAFHNTGVNWGQPATDLGRFEQTRKPKDLGRFKTPSLRNVSSTAPYMHDGSFQSLEEVIEFYNKAGIANPNRDRAIRKLDLTARDKSDLLAFLLSLSDPRAGDEHEE